MFMKLAGLSLLWDILSNLPRHDSREEGCGMREQGVTEREKGGRQEGKLIIDTV